MEIGNGTKMETEMERKVEGDCGLTVLGAILPREDTPISSAGAPTTRGILPNGRAARTTTSPCATARVKHVAGTNRKASTPGFGR